ncbi:MAG: serine hydrolase [Gemmatimonadota bacterium]
MQRFLAGCATRMLAGVLAVVPFAAGSAQTRAGGSQASRSADAIVHELDGFIRQGMKDWEVPGLSIALVHNDSILLTRGYGVRRLGEPGAVDGQTLFGMMSTTKAMTSLAVAMLVDDGRLTWDDPVTKWVPEFQMPDPYVTRDLRVVDLLTHNTGLPNADLLWSRGDLGSEEIFRRMRLLTPAYPLRGGFVYHNVMYGLAGEVIARASGMSYGDFLRRRLFGPLGMSRTYPSYARMAAAGDPNVSSPHYRIHQTVQPIADETVDTLASAGAIWSSAEDMATWIRFLLDSAQVAGRRLLSDSGYRMLFAPHAIIPADEFYPTMELTRPHWTTYGLGWFEQDYRGHFVAFHTGSLDGRTAIIGLLPDERVGVYVFGNLDHAEFRHAVMLKVFDLFLGGAPRDWNRELLALYAGRRARADSAQQAAGQAPGTLAPASQAPANYAGKYVHPIWGDAEIALVGEGLQFQMGASPELRGPMTHWNLDSWHVALGDGRSPPIVVQFILDPDGRVAELRIPDVDGAVFRRVP